jgi:hypothetical protein
VEVLAAMRQKVPELFIDDLLYLGSVASDRSITAEEISAFIENIIVYCIVRQRLKKYLEKHNCRKKLGQYSDS